MLNIYIKLCIKLISLSTCKKLSGLVHQKDLGHHQPPPMAPPKTSRKTS